MKLIVLASSTTKISLPSLEFMKLKTPFIWWWKHLKEDLFMKFLRAELFYQQMKF